MIIERKRTGGIRALVLFIVLCMLMGMQARGETVDVDALRKSIEEKKSSISDANKQREDLKNGMTDVQSVLKNLKNTRDNLNAYVAELDAQVNQLEQKIAELSEQIEEKEAGIQQVRAELEEAKKVEASQYEAMKQRIRFMYERGATFYLEFLLDSGSMGDILNRVEYVEQVTAYDRRKLEEFAAAREQVEVLEQQLQAEIDLLEETKSVQEKEQQSLNALIAEKEKEVAAYEAKIKDQEAVLADFEAEINARNAVIKALEAQIKAEQSKIDEANRPKYNGGKFAFPAPSYTRISDDYGNRMHPILKVNKFHNGIDLAAPSGSPILAAYDGVVAASGYDSSMGNYCMIDHGSGITTVYMHASSISVGKGAKVSKGQQIGKVGSTGRSTGPHLHFSVRENGNYVSPWKYLK